MLTVKRVVVPTLRAAGVNAQVVLAEQPRLMVPLKLLPAAGPFASIRKVVSVGTNQHRTTCRVPGARKLGRKGVAFRQSPKALATPGEQRHWIGKTDKRRLGDFSDLDRVVPRRACAIHCSRTLRVTWKATPPATVSGHRSQSLSIVAGGQSAKPLAVKPPRPAAVTRRLA